ncbi:MAG TPA: hypothetical protein VHW26_11255 [Solirubrobacteraceae bacterium]|nr:hypothetical protein [Solirubrobacteraceae bacterium]
MTATRSPRLAVLLAGLVLLLTPTGAAADGDPASDVLLIANVFYPYQQKVSNNLIVALNLATARAHTAKFPIKVAIIATPADLGAVPDLFAKPQQYANFLDKEISFNGTVALLVVMQAGFGLVASGPQSALAGLKIPDERGSNGLAAAAIRAVGLLAASAGHPIALPPIPAGGSTSTGNSALITFVAPAALVLVVVAVVAFTRPSTPSPKVEEDEPQPAGDDG